MKREETIDFHLKWIWHNISRYYNAIASEYGLTMATGNILLAIDKRDGTPSTKLGPSMGMTSRSLVRSLKNLETSGLVYKEADAIDKRKVRIRLTEEGLRMREISKRTVLELNDTLYKNLSEEEVKTLFKTLNIINESINSISQEKNEKTH